MKKGNAIIFTAIAIVTVCALTRWWQSAEQRRLRDVARQDREQGAGNGGVDLDDFLNDELGR